MQEFQSIHQLQELSDHIKVNGWISNAKHKAVITAQEADFAYHLNHNAMNMALMDITSQGINFYLNKLAGFTEKSYDYNQPLSPQEGEPRLEP